MDILNNKLQFGQGCWWQNILVTFWWWQFLDFDNKNLSNRSLTSKSCYQQKLSPTSVTNIGVARLAIPWINQFLPVLQNHIPSRCRMLRISICCDRKMLLPKTWIVNFTKYEIRGWIFGRHVRSNFTLSSLNFMLIQWNQNSWP